MRLISCACVIMALAVPSSLSKPHYIAVPADQIEFLDLENLQALTRHTRHVPQSAHSPQYQPQGLQHHRYEQPVAAMIQDTIEASSEDNPRHSNRVISNYADFGAHTGNNGAFGWYSDYPVFSNF